MKEKDAPLAGARIEIAVSTIFHGLHMPPLAEARIKKAACQKHFLPDRLPIPL